MNTATYARLEKIAVFVCASIGAVALLMAQSTAPAPAAALRFADISEGDLLTSGRTIHATLNKPGLLAGVRSVEFWFKPDFGTAIHLGTDSVGTVPTFGPDCSTPPCVAEGIYQMAVNQNLQTAPTGWGVLSARATGVTMENVKDAALRVYWSFVPLKAQFTQPHFMDVLPAGGSFSVVAATQATDITAFTVQWYLTVNIPGRNINPFEQHVLGFDLTPGGHASCVPTAVGANLAWLNDTSRWQTRSMIHSSLCNGQPDRCLVAELGFLMQTDGAKGGTSGAGADQGLLAYLTARGFKQNTDYWLEHLGGAAVTPEALTERFQAGDMISVGVHNLPNTSSFGHFLALDNILMRADGSAMVRLMDPHTVNNPPQYGVYRWFSMQPSGVINWSTGTPAPGYGPAGNAVLNEAQVVSGFHFFQNLNALAMADSTVVSTVPVEGTVSGTTRNGTFIGTFTPPAGSPGPWLLVSEVTTVSGHKQRDYKYVLRTPLPRP